ARSQGADGAGWHTHADGPTHRHGGAHGPLPERDDGAAAPRLLRLERDVLAANDTIAARNREAFARRGVFALNLVSSPGSGKTTLLVRTIERLAGRLPVTVIEGDQQTSFDAERIRATGAPAIQINTGKGCHLDAAMVETALGRLAPAEGSVLMIENVGNLVCPAGFDLGEAHKVVVLSVTEGEDKPLKYPKIFREARIAVLTKMDLLPYVPFDVEQAVAFARQINPRLQFFRTSALNGVGMHEWYTFLRRSARKAVPV
ncbi:MAG TPA: hydrogenase nickel incorporation protein HypB, partial [Gemmatimonadales bacterium]|nr:hydrogenase nickel incorporation protein HypB [Gemmatimonadales bacterium]